MIPTFAEQEQNNARRLVEMALKEDLQDVGDLTCQALIPPQLTATVQVRAREQGVLAGGPIAKLVYEMLSQEVQWNSLVPDGTMIEPGTVVAEVSGPTAVLLTGERTALNFLIHLSGIASRTRKFVDAISHTRAALLDTRKTLPGWRILHKYAVRCGGGTNHRMGLYDGILIKDNHLASWLTEHPGGTLAKAVQHARSRFPGQPVEVEVDTLEQLRDVLQAAPEIVLLDNMTPDQLRDCVILRDQMASGVLLEASGGISFSTIAAIAESGVDRISVGGLTHSAPALDLGYDWPETP